MHGSLRRPDRVRNVIEYRSSFVGEIACCHFQRATPSNA
jgi:hypothetical protein